MEEYQLHDDMVNVPIADFVALAGHFCNLYEMAQGDVTPEAKALRRRIAEWRDRYWGTLEVLKDQGWDISSLGTKNG